MIFLTGDVHHMSMGGHDQKQLDSKTEVDLCYPYLEIANSYNIIPTLFFTGKVVEEETTKLKDLQSKFDFEIGGHTYWCYRPWYIWYFYGFFNRIFGLSKGPAWWQKMEIERTIKVIKNELGVSIKSWRDHGYRYDRNTYRLLAECGIAVVSDEIDIEQLQPRAVAKNLYSLPINTTPDHENLVHSSEHTVSFGISEWLSLVKGQIDDLINQGGVATILAHPACMWIEDKFDSFELLCNFTSDYPTPPAIKTLPKVEL